MPRKSHRHHSFNFNNAGDQPGRPDLVGEAIPPERSDVCWQPLDIRFCFAKVKVCCGSDSKQTHASVRYST